MAENPFDLNTFERGRDLGVPSPQDPNAVPRGSELVVPHSLSFAGNYNTTARAFSQRFDEAMSHSRANAWKMRLDPIISTCLEVRAVPVSLLTWTLAPEDPEDQRQVDAAKRQEKLIRRMPRFVEMHRWLSVEGDFVGRAGAEILKRPAGTFDGRMMYQPSGWKPVGGDKLAWKWDGRVGVSVYGSWSDPHVEHLDGNPVYFFDREERENIVVHRKFSEDSDYYKPQHAGAIHGTGLRGKLYWFWALKSQIWQMSLEFLRWFSKGLMIYYFQHGNASHLAAVREWVEKQDGNSAMLFPVMPGSDGKPYLPTPLQRIDVGTASPEFLMRLITNYFDDIFRFCILHQTSTTTSPGSTGLGSGVASAHEGTNENRVKMDAMMLQESYTLDLVAPMYRVNEPGIPPARFEFSIDSPNVQQMLDTAQAIVSMGGSVPMEPLVEAGGIPAAKPSDTLLTQVQPQSAVAAGALPDGTAAVAAGPDGQQPV